MTREPDCALIGKWRIVERGQAHSTGSVELEDHDTLSGNISFHLSDEPEFKARR